MYKTDKWIQILSTMLSMFSMKEIVFSITLLFFLKDLTYFCQCEITTMCFLIAGLFTLPTSFKVKIFPSYGKFTSFQSYMHIYNVATLCISVIAQIVAMVFILLSIVNSNKIAKNFGRSIINYKQNITDKTNVDTVQLFLQCCGTNSYQDWSHVVWDESKENERFSHINSELVEEESSDKHDPEYWISVPFSCCKIKSERNCLHENLYIYGTESINTIGCGKRFTYFVVGVLVAQLVTCIMSIIAMIILLRLIRVTVRESSMQDMDRLSFSDEEDVVYSYDWNSNKTKNEFSPRSEERFLLPPQNSRKFSDIKAKFP